MGRPTKKQRRIARRARAQLLERTIQSLSQTRTTWSGLAEAIADHIDKRMAQETFARRILPIIHAEAFEPQTAVQQDAQ